MDALADRITRHADALERDRRSPLYIALMRGAADSARRDGPVADVFPDGPGAPGSAPAGRLLAALHHLVLAGDAPQLARYYASVGGEEPLDHAWAAAEATIEGEVRRLAARTVQTNEPGRSAALYGALLRLADRHRLPIRLLEPGASAGLNLHADRYRYVVAGRPLGDPASRLSFDEPWEGLPVEEPWMVESFLCLSERCGCDPAPIDVSTQEGALALLSYIWPDELDRLARIKGGDHHRAGHTRPSSRRQPPSPGSSAGSPNLTPAASPSSGSQSCASTSERPSGASSRIESKKPAPTPPTSSRWPGWRSSQATTISRTSRSPAARGRATGGGSPSPTAAPMARRSAGGLHIGD